MRKMTSRERLIAVSKKQPVDMIPLSPRVGYAAHYHCGTASDPNLLRLKKTYDYDPFLTIPGHDLPFKSPYEVFDYAPGVEVEIKVKDDGSKRMLDKTIHTPDGNMHEVQLVPNPGRKEYGFLPDPMHIEYMVKTPEDLLKLRHLIPPVNTNWVHEYHGLEYIAGEEAVTRVYLYGPIDHQAGKVMSLEDIMINYLTNKEFAVKLVDMFWQRLKEQTKALLEGGVRYFFIPWFWHSVSAGWSPQIFREWFFPMIKEQVDLIHSYDGIANYYDDGKCMDIIPMMLEANMDVFETCTPPPVGDFDIVKAKEICGNKMTLMGYTDLIYVIQKGTVEDVRKTVKEACEIGGKNGCFILGTSDSIREDSPIENIDAYFKYGREYAKQSS
jgi:hypothetical protein